MSLPRPIARASRLSLALPLALFAGTVLQLWTLPRVLGDSDEGLYLYEAKRLLEGAVFYRDVFDLITPGSHLLMAAVFRLFGTDMAVARAADAVIHGLIVVCMYACCRVLGVGRGLAAAAALTDPAVFRPGWAVASPHWLSTLFSLVVLLVALRGPGQAFLGGIAVGLVIAVQQQRGGLVGAAMAAILVADHLLLMRRQGWRRLGRALAEFGGGVSCIVVPLGLFLVAKAGPSPVFKALVVYPLVHYSQSAAGAPWGYVGAFGWNARHTFPTLLTWLPGLAVLAALRAGADWWRGAPSERVRRSVALALSAPAWIASILYFPDYIHLAIIGPIFAVVAADLLAGALAPPRAASRVAGGIGTAFLLVAIAFQLERVSTGSWQDYPIVHHTPFGTMNFRDRNRPDQIEWMRTLLRDSGTDELFVYPAGAAWYLWTDTINPTPYQFLAASYNGPDQLAETVAILDRRRLPYVIGVMLLAGDPVSDYLRAHYTPMKQPAGQMTVLRRNDAGERVRP